MHCDTDMLCWQLVLHHTHKFLVWYHYCIMIMQDVFPAKRMAPASAKNKQKHILQIVFCIHFPRGISTKSYVFTIWIYDYILYIYYIR